MSLTKPVHHTHELSSFTLPPGYFLCASGFERALVYLQGFFFKNLSAILQQVVSKRSTRVLQQGPSQQGAPHAVCILFVSPKIAKGNEKGSGFLAFFQ